MNISMGQLADMVSVRLGEYPRRRPRGGYQEASLEEICGSLAVPAAVRLTLREDIAELDCMRDMRDILNRSADYGDGVCAECELPADFLRLRYLRMKGWARGVESMTCACGKEGDGTAGGLLMSLGEAAPEWMRRQRARVSAELLPPTDGKGALRIRLTPLIEAGISEGVYIPVPYLEDGCLCDVSSCILLDLTEALAEAAGRPVSRL